MDRLDLLFNPKEFADAFGAVAGDSRPQAMESPPDATVWLEGGAASAGARPGFAWNHGQIDYQGNSHSFSISGLSIADLPAVSISATGIVKHLKTLSAFVGDYFAATADGRLTAGASVTGLRNDRGVLIQLIATNAGQRFDVSINGVRIGSKN